VVDGMATLVEQHLVRVEEGSEEELRFALLETIREYGQSCLAQSGEAEALRRHHARFVTALAEEAEPELVRDDQGRGWRAWRPSRTTSGQRWPGRWRASRRPPSGWRRRFHGSGRFGIANPRAGRR